MMLALLSATPTPSPIYNGQVVTDLTSIMSTIASTIQSNSILKIFLTTMFIGLGVGVFRSLKRIL